MVKPDKLPQGSKLVSKVHQTDFCDALTFVISEEGMSPAQVYVAIFGQLPSFVQQLMSIRNRIVKPFGFKVQDVQILQSVESLKTREGEGLHQVKHMDEQEIICSSEEQHMQVWLSVFKHSERQFTISTMVSTRSTVGKYYLKAVIPFHKIVAMASVRAMLKTLNAKQELGS